MSITTLIARPGIFILDGEKNTDEQNILRGCNNRIMSYHQIENQELFVTKYFNIEKKSKNP